MMGIIKKLIIWINWFMEIMEIIKEIIILIVILTIMDIDIKYIKKNKMKNNIFCMIIVYFFELF
jgi:hypothetical protein